MVVACRALRDGSPRSGCSVPPASTRERVTSAARRPGALVVCHAERAVRSLEGVENVVNNIEILPLSPNDDQIRRAVYRAIYSQPGLDLYSLRAVPTIHIIVKNGNVILTGAVGTQMDKQRAEIAAKGVAGVFSVTNNIQIG